MRTERLEGNEGRGTLVVVFDPGEEVAEGLLTIARDHGIEGAYFTAIGALSDATLGYWEWETKSYRRIPVREQVEVLSLLGNVAIGPDGHAKVHAHLVVGYSDGTARGGHLLDAHVRPTLEVMITEVPEHLRRRFDPTTGLPLLDPRG